jgi:fumarate reductase (CoM/CoB) subunit A
MKGYLMSVNVNNLECDVLIIGGGLTALRAGIEAIQMGSSVILVCKRKVARSGSSAFTTGGYAASIGDDDDWNLHLADTMTGGAHIGDKALQEILCREATVRLSEIEGAGIRFQKTKNRYNLFSSGDHGRARIAMPDSPGGIQITLPIRKWAEKEGCAFLENTFITDLLRDGKQVVGALGFNRLDGSIWTVSAGATILATGGAGRIFSITSNPIDVTGDGYALALRASARLRDMEFIQFYPWRVIHPFPKPRFSIQANTWVSGARLYNAAGDRFMKRYDPVRMEATTRDIAARAIFDQIRNGDDVKGGVRVDISRLPAGKWREINPQLAAQFMKHRTDPRNTPVIVAPEAHFMMGGVIIDAFCQSDLPGLFAAGELAGGIHGGNRIDSNALPETQVFGARAGRSAASFALDCKGCHKNFDPDCLLKLQNRLSPVINYKRFRASTKIKSLRTAFYHWSNKSLGIVRDGNSICAALKAIRGIRESIIGVTVDNIEDLLNSIEIENLCLTSEACLESALFRKESRGSHFRDDYPERNPSFSYGISSSWNSDAFLTKKI